MCAGFRHDIILFDLESASQLQLLRAASSQDQVAVLGTAPDRNEYIVCHNQETVFKDAYGDATRDYLIRWVSQPHGVAYVPPYLLGFTSDTIEVVTLINGKLVKNIPTANVFFLTAKDDVYFTAQEQASVSIHRISRARLGGKVRVRGCRCTHPHGLISFCVSRELVA